MRILNPDLDLRAYHRENGPVRSGASFFVPTCKALIERRLPDLGRSRKMLFNACYVEWLCV